MSKALRPIMTRIPEKLRRRLALSAKGAERSMNAEIIHRLEQSFDPTFKRAEIVSAMSEVYESIQKDKREREIACMQQAANFQKEMREMERLCRIEMEKEKLVRRMS